MVLGLIAYLALRPKYLAGIGERPPRDRVKTVDEKPAAPLSAAEKRRLAALLVIIVFTIPFWMAFEQAASSMNFFAAQRTDRWLLGFRFPASWFQMVNPAVLIIVSPFIATLWTRLGARGRDPSTPSKMAAALTLLGLGFVVLVVGAGRSDAGHLVSPMWLIGAYALHTLGELCLSPIGLSLVTKLAPAKLAALMMGAWFFATGISELLAGQLAAFTEKVARGEVFHLLGGQADFFLIFVVTSGLSALALLAVRPWLKRLMA
jgi:POT family proton-dependent oligopeptide transporter